jgi:DNA-binding IclR family transcriptional regulator
MLAPSRPDSRYSVPNLDRALSMLELLSGAPEGMSQKELASALEIPSNSVFRISRTLEDRGYLERDEVNKRLRLTQKLLRLSCRPSSGERSVTECSLEAMRALREDTLETVLLGTLSGAEGIVIEQISGKHPFRFVVDVGVRFALHTAAPGKAMLSALPTPEAEAIIAQMPFTRFNARTITDADAFRKELQRTRAAGYGIDEGEEREGAHCIGAGILNSLGVPVAAVWVTGPSSRLPIRDFPRVGKRVKDAAAQISAKLGYFRH